MKVKIHRAGSIGNHFAQASRMDGLLIFVMSIVKP